MPEEHIMFEQKIETLNGSRDDLNTWIYRCKDNGIIMREAEFYSNKPGGKPVRIMQVSDLHINYLNESDLLDEELLYTKECRKWLADGESVPGIQKVISCASEYDQTVITGDTLDFLSNGGIELMQKYIWDVEPETLIALGGHDLTKNMQTNRPDKLPLSERYEILKKAWKHDIFYVSKVLEEKVMLIVLDNGNHSYREEQAWKLERDIIIAREKGYIILIFQHEPICTGNPDDSKKECIREYDGKYRNFYDRCVGFQAPEGSATQKVYCLLTENADVIKAFFCGHNHSMFFTEVKASYRDAEGNIVETLLPQYIVTPSAYDENAGHIMKITVW